MHVRDHLLIAIRNNHPNSVVGLIDKINLCDEIENKKTPIQLARDLGHWDCVDTIAREKKTDFTDAAEYGDVLLTAVQLNRIKTTRLLLEAGASRTWYVTANGDSCLHAAIRANNARIVALLFSFDFDIKVENLAKQTPIQLADSLKVSSLSEGWRIHHDLTFKKTIFPPLIQSMRQCNSAFYKIPYICSELIVSFLSYETPSLKKETIVSRKNSFIKISIQSFLKAYKPKMISSKHEKEFVNEMKIALQNNHSVVENIHSAINKFLKNNKGKKTRIPSLLYRYKLVNIEQNNKDEKKEEIYSLASRLKK